MKRRIKDLSSRSKSGRGSREQKTYREGIKRKYGKGGEKNTRTGTTGEGSLLIQLQKKKKKGI